jgi:hypothetical protein
MTEALFKKPGCCTQCHAPITLAYIATRTVCWQIVSDLSLCQQENVPLCEDCTTPKEQAFCQHQRDCLGCGMTMHCGWNFASSFCSARCQKRSRRQRRQQHRPMMTCTVCKVQFKPKRTDAQFCSGACRQWAYRRRSGPKVGYGGYAPIGGRNVT